jgi:amidohydrolase
MEVGVAGLETAFVGRFDSPAGTDGPSLGIIVEYDALRGTGKVFHGCQHNAQGPIGVAAAVAISEYMKKESVPGQIYVYGTPAEEMGPPSKKIMNDEGIFNNADFLVRSHGGDKISRTSAGFGVCCLNIDMVRYHFEGSPSHQRESWKGRNALEAATMFYTAVDKMRSTWRPEASIQATIPEGGTAPNIVPDSAVVDYYVRYPDEVYLGHIKSMMDDMARASAQATGTKVSIEDYGSYRDGLSVSTLEELYFAYAQKYEDPSDLDDELKSPSGYEETGFVSRGIPGVGISMASSPAPGHTYQRALDSMKPVGHEGFRAGAKIMTAILYDFLTNNDFRKLVEEEHQMLKSGFDSYIENLQGAYKDEMSIQIDK